MKTKYEYKIEAIDYYGSPSEVKPDHHPNLNRLGEQGWELVSIVLIQQTVYGYFKKQI